MAIAFTSCRTGACRPDDPIVALYARLRGPLRRLFASYRLNAVETEDLTQEVFVRMVGRTAPRTLHNPEGYAFTLARNLLKDRARRACTRPATAAISLDHLDIPSQLPSPEEAFECAERLEEATSVLNSLRAETRLAFLLHRLHGASYASIAAQLGVSISMVEKHIMGALSALRPLEQ